MIFYLQMPLSLGNYCKLSKHNSIIKKETKTILPVIKTNADKATMTSDMLERSNDDAEKENNGNVKIKLSRSDRFREKQNAEKKRKNQQWFKRPLNIAGLHNGPFFRMNQDGMLTMVQKITPENAHLWDKFQ